MKITPKTIIERHEKYPEATETLIESYAFQEYQKAIKDLMNVSDVTQVKHTDTTLIVLSNMSFKEWKDLSSSHWYINKPKI